MRPIGVFFDLRRLRLFGTAVANLEKCCFPNNSHVRQKLQSGLQPRFEGLNLVKWLLFCVAQSFLSLGIRRRGQRMVCLSVSEGLLAGTFCSL